MAPSWKPDGYSTVSPYLITAAQEVIEFLTATFDAEPLRRYEDEDGGIIHAEVRVGDSVIMLGGATDEWPPVPCHVHVYVEDVEDAYARALAAGAAPVQEPVRRDEDPDRRGGVKGPGGNTWWIATQVAD